MNVKDFFHQIMTKYDKKYFKQTGRVFKELDRPIKVNILDKDACMFSLYFDELCLEDDIVTFYINKDPLLSKKYDEIAKVNFTDPETYQIVDLSKDSN